MSIGLLNGWAAGFALACIAGLLLWKAAKRSGVEETARDVNAETERQIKELKAKVDAARAAPGNPDDWL